MTNNVNFDELAQKSFAPGSTSDDYEKMFAAVFSLPEWHFIADGEMPNLSPYCALFPDSFGDQPAVAVFTDTERARKFMAESSTKFGSADKPVGLNSGNMQMTFSSEDLIMSVPTTNILDYIEKLIPKGIVKIFFNPNTDSHGFHHDLKMMRPIYEHLESKNLIAKTPPNTDEAENVSTPVETKDQPTVDQIATEMKSSGGVDFDALARKMTETNAMEDMNETFGNVLALPEWNFISRGEMPNVYPYVASNPQYADNQPMIRAFTDTKRLQRFAQENNLTEADGSALMLTIPTANIVEYLEGFIPQGAYGVWFNSDLQSEGFFIPIKQLQPIKDHLAKINWQKKDAQKLSVETLQFVVREGLMLPSGEIKTAPYTSNVFWRVPENWLENGKIKAEHLRTFEQELSGGRSKTIEGAFYVPVDYSIKIFTPEDVKTTDWHAIKENSDDSCTFFIISETGEVRFVSAEEFQKDVDSYFQTTGISKQSPSSVETLIVQIKDGLGFPSGFVKASEDTLHLFCRVPSNWVNGEQLKPEYLEKIYAQFYGANWRAGNSDGSHYKILDSYTKIFPLETVKTTKFSDTVNQDKHQFFFYIGDENGAVRKVSSEEFQADVDASFQTHTTDEARKRQDNLANWGMSETADGDFDLNLTVNKVGAVNFDTSIAPFYEAIVPLLNDYKGTGEYVSLLRFEASGKSDEVENIAENANGAYLQIRRFIYLNPKNGVRIGVNSIHSNKLRHVQSNAELLISIELCKNLDNQTGVFYHAFQGPKSDVLRLSEAVQPLLKANGYQAVQ